MADYSIKITVKREGDPVCEKYYGFPTEDGVRNKFIELRNLRDTHKPIMVNGLVQWIIVGPIIMTIEE